MPITNDASDGSSNEEGSPGAFFTAVRSNAIMFNRTRTPVLGVMRGADALYAVLLERTEGTVVQTSFSPTLIPEAKPDSASSSPDGVLGMEDEASDVTLHFEGEEAGGTGAWSGEGATRSSSPSRDVRSALDALLSKCARRGYENPSIALCAPHSEMDQVELRVPPSEVDSESNPGDLPAPRAVLLDLLGQQRQVQEGRAGFLPMSPGPEGEPRALALMSRPNGAVSSAIASMPRPSLLRGSPVDLLETEVSVYFGWARSILGPFRGRSETSLVVRVGTEDTLLLFLEGDALKRIDTLPSLTIDDPPDTICSRVLLYQDEYGLGDVQHILLMSEGDEQELVEGFEPYFSNADLQLLRDRLPYQSDKRHRGLYAAATGAAVRALNGGNEALEAPRMNLMGREQSRVFWSPSMGRGTAALVLLLVLGTGVGFGWYGVHNAREIRQSRSELRALERKVAQVDPDALKARADSLQSILDRQSRSRDVTEGLLRGSNKWSRALAAVATQAETAGEISIRNWTPRTSTEVEVKGHAAARPSIVSFAEGLGGEIMSVSFTEIRGRSLYAFSIRVPLDTTRPEAVSYWRSKQGALAAETDTAEEEGNASRVVPSRSASTAPDTKRESRPLAPTQGEVPSVRSVGRALQVVWAAAGVVWRARRGLRCGFLFPWLEGGAHHA